MATKVEVLAEQSSDVSLQGDIIRCRVPSSILHTAGAEEPHTTPGGKKKGDAIDWQTLTNGEDTWIVGTVNKGGMQGRQATATASKAPAKAASKKPAAKKSAVKAVKVSAGDLDSAFEDDWGDSAPVKKLTAPRVTKPTAAKGATVVKPASTKGGKYDVPTRR
jgi:hypothetical protein